MAEKWKERQDSFDKVYDFSQETFTGIRVIKAFVKEAHELNAFSKVAKNSADKNIGFAKTHISFDVAIEIIIGVIMALLNGFGGYVVYKTAIHEPIVIFNQVNSQGEQIDSHSSTLVDNAVELSDILSAIVELGGCVDELMTRIINMTEAQE